MRGDVIVCKDFMGKFLEMRIWEDLGQIVFVHNSGQFSAHMSGNPHLEPVGFPVEDVFKRDGSGKLIPYALSRQDHSQAIEPYVSSA
jgi:hypothetical protein